VVSIFATPPAGMSFLERRTPVQPHPASIFFMTRSDVPVFFKTNTWRTVESRLSCPKLWVGDSISAFGAPMQIVVMNTVAEIKK
jgi:hypothetical protein